MQLYWSQLHGSHIFCEKQIKILPVKNVKIAFALPFFFHFLADNNNAIILVITLENEDIENYKTDQIQTLHFIKT